MQFIPRHVLVAILQKHNRLIAAAAASPRALLEVRVVELEDSILTKAGIKQSS